MGKENYDIFLVLTRKDGRAVYGESTDAYFQKDADGKFQGPIEINDFNFAVEKPSFDAKKSADSDTKLGKVSFDGLGQGEASDKRKAEASKALDKGRETLRFLKGIIDAGADGNRSVRVGPVRHS